MAKKKDYIIDKSKRKEKFKKSKKSSNCGLEKKCDKFITCNPPTKNKGNKNPTVCGPHLIDFLDT